MFIFIKDLYVIIAFFYVLYKSCRYRFWLLNYIINNNGPKSCCNNTYILYMIYVVEM